MNNPVASSPLKAGFWFALCVIGVALCPLMTDAASPWFSGYLNSTNSYRIYAFTDWDTPLFGGGIQPDSDCLGVASPSYRVDGHVVYEADGKGNCVVIESTGSYAISMPMGSVSTVTAAQFGGWWQNPGSAPTSDTRHDWNSQFLNIVSDPIVPPADTTPVHASIALAPSLTVAVSWPSLTNRNYRVMWTSQLTNQTMWYFLGIAVAGNGTQSTAYDGATNSSRYYRVIAVE